MDMQTIKCQSCGASLGHVIARCPYCGTFSTVKEEPNAYAPGTDLKKDISNAVTSVKNAIISKISGKNGNSNY